MSPLKLPSTGQVPAIALSTFEYGCVATFAALESAHGRETLNSPEGRVVDVRARKCRPFELRTSQVGAGQVRAREIDIAQIGVAQVRKAQISADQLRAVQLRAPERR